MPEQERRSPNDGKESAPAEVPFRSILAFEQRLLRLALVETWGELRSRTKELLVAVLAALLGAASGIVQGSIADAAKNAVLAVLAACVLVYLWNLATMPARERAAARAERDALESARDALQTEVQREQSTAADLALRLADRDSEIDNLNSVHRAVAAERDRLQAALAALPKVELIPKRDEHDSIAAIQYTVEYTDAQRTPLEATLLWGSLYDIVVVNHDRHPTELLRMWLRVRDSASGDEIVPIRDKDFRPPQLPIEDFQPLQEITGQPDRQIEKRGQRHYRLKHIAYYPGSLWRGTKEDKARSVSLCVTTSGLGETCYPLDAEFFYDRNAKSGMPREQNLNGAINELSAAHQRITRVLPRLTLPAGATAKEEVERRALRRDEEKRHLESLRENEFQAYRRAFAALNPRARAIHERIYERMGHIRFVAELSDPIEELEQMRVYGTPDLEVDISNEGSYFIFRKDGGRKRFLIAPYVTITNQSATTVNLFPRLWLRPDLHDEVHFMPEAEPLKEWEAYRHDLPCSSSAPLAMPLRLGPSESAFGSLCFYIDDDLEETTPTLAKVRTGTYYLEIADLIGGKRAQARHERLELDALRSGSAGASELT